MSTKLLIIAALTLQPMLGQLGPSELLHRAALRGETASIKMLLQLGTDVNLKDQHGRTALHDACLKGHLETTRLLLDRGAKVSARDEIGATPLHDAALGGDRKVVELLLARKADANARDSEGHTPLDYALKMDRVEAAQALRSVHSQ